MDAANPAALGQVSVHRAAWTISSSAWVIGQDVYLHLSHCSGPHAYEHRPSFFMLSNEYTSLWVEMAVRNRQIFLIYNSNMRQGGRTGSNPSSLQQHPSAINLRVQFCITARTALCQGAAAGFFPYPYFGLGVFFFNCIFSRYCIVASGWDCASNFIQRKTLLMNLFINCLQCEFSAGSAR